MNTKNNKAQSTRQLILSAAEQVFARYGFEGATTEKIAQQAGLPKANVHYYFKTKENLYRKVLELILVAWMEAANAFDEYAEPCDALSCYIESKMQFSRNRPYASKVWANEVLHGVPILDEFLKNSLRDWLENRVTLIKGWIAEGKMRAVDPTVFIYMIWSVTQHYADFDKQIVLLNEDKALTDEEYRYQTGQVVDLILNSVGLQRPVSQVR
ncbi:MAG: TetR family transcriptional regulator C-terminal domain-containing protein [Enterobacterales bacterium]|nr:TetR family transcriptional regulator C-terminal domain-containing protein [Enterobacterales bacterium]